MEPLTSAQLLSAGSNVLGKALSGGMSAAPAGPSSVNNTSPYDWVFDSSGWNVTFGSGAITSEATKTTTDANPLGLTGLTGGTVGWQTVAVIGLGLVAVWAIRRRR